MNLPKELREGTKVTLDDNNDDINTTKIKIPEQKYTNKIVDLEQVTNTVVKILEYISTPQMTELEKTDKEAFDSKVENEFEEFSLNQISIFKMLMDTKNRSQNIVKLMDMITTLKQVQAGNKNMKDEFENLKETLASEYIYPQFGSKDAFVAHMKKHQKKPPNKRK